MTVYACGAGWPGRDGELFNLWADTPDEAFMAMIAIGGDPDAQRRQECNAWEAYAITAEQLTIAASLSVTITDKWGPVLWLARRDGRHALVERVLHRQAN